MTDTIRVLNGVVVGVARFGQPLGAGEGEVFEVSSGLGVCAGQLWDAEAGEASDPAPAPLTFQQAQAVKRATVIAAADAAFAAGYAPDSGTLAGQTLQVRTTEDRTNWLTSQATYGAAVAAGQGVVEGAMFRTASNQTFMLTFAEGYQLLVQGMAAWGQSIYANLWALKDAVAAAEDQAALDAIDETAGWP